MRRDLARSLSRALTRIFQDGRGASATIVAIALPGLIGFGALGAETGVWYTIKLRTQSAADAAAISAAYEVIAGKTNIASELTPAASEAATRNGYTGTTPAVIYPYSDNGISNGVAVALQQTHGALLASMFLSRVTIATKAVAAIEVLDNPCILALGASGTDVEVGDGSRVDMSGCSVAANSSSRNAIDLHGSTSSIIATTLVTRGEVSFQGNRIDPAAPPSQFALSSPPMIGAPRIADPYAGILTHNFLTTGMPTADICGSTTSGGVTIYRIGNCVIAAASLIQSSIRLPANTQISGSWVIGTGQIVDLSPGTYWITGDLIVQSSAILKCSTCDNVNGAGVTIILAADNNEIGTMAIASNVTLNLNAPSSGMFAGLVIVQDSNGLPPGTTYPSSLSMFGIGSGASLNGLVYFPNSSMTFQGNPNASGPKCLVLVVNALTLDGASSLETSGCANAGLATLPTVNTVALAE